uniref:Translocase of inner mitochondrial membrane 23 homolog b (yeast) n=1 Tax=Salmo trutta TaxID=8032 RepID=A0A673YL98_SALTR
VDNTSSSGPIKGGFSIFGGAWPEYSNTEFGLTIVCVFLSGMSPRSPYLNVDPRYCTHDPDDLILPTDANKVSGRFELAFFTIAGCCITCAAVGALNGPRMGLSETKDMAWSKPLNMSCVFNGYDILTFTLLNLVTRQGATWANTLGSLVCLGVVIEKARGAEDDINTVAAGIMTGMLYKSTALAHISLTFCISGQLWK